MQVTPTLTPVSTNKVVKPTLHIDKVTVDIDKYQHENIEEEKEEFVSITDVEENEDWEFNFETQNQTENEYVIDHKFSKHQMNIKKACIFPGFDVIEKYNHKVYAQTGKILSFSETLKAFCKSSTFSKLYFMRDVTDFLDIAVELDSFWATNNPNNRDFIDPLLDSYAVRSIQEQMYYFLKCPIRFSPDNKKNKLSIMRHFFAELSLLSQVRTLWI